jgi:hypothetical protein
VASDAVAVKNRSVLSSGRRRWAQRLLGSDLKAAGSDERDSDKTQDRSN